MEAMPTATPPRAPMLSLRLLAYLPTTAARTRLLVLRRSITTPAATTTRPAVFKRSLATQPAAPTRQSVTIHLRATLAPTTPPSAAAHLGVIQSATRILLLAAMRLMSIPTAATTRLMASTRSGAVQAPVRTPHWAMPLATI